MHEVSEAAEHRQDADDEVPDRVTGSIEEVEEDDEADGVETVGQRVVATEASGEAAAESVEFGRLARTRLKKLPERARRAADAATRSRR